MTEVENVLREARALVENGWCQGRFSCRYWPVGDYREHLDMPLVVRHVAPGNERQQCYCLTGAVASATSSVDVLEAVSYTHLTLPTKA